MIFFIPDRFFSSRCQKSIGSQIPDLQQCNEHNIFEIQEGTIPASLEILENPMLGPKITLGVGDEGKIS
jgi:hypothetical protein